MANLTRTIKRSHMFKGMNAKQKKLLRAERKNARDNPQAEAERRANIIRNMQAKLIYEFPESATGEIQEPKIKAAGLFIMN